MNAEMMHSVLLVVVAVATHVYSAAPESCYPLTGCFSNQAPWTSDTRPAPPPQHPNQISNSMTLYTTETPDGNNFTIFPEINLNGLAINTSRPTFVLIHGFGGSATGPWILAVKDSLLRRAGGNVLTIAWGPSQTSYEQASSNTRVAGKLLGIALESMRLEPSTIHIMARCIGSHIAAYAAKYINQNGDKVGRITAMNPGRVLFQGQPAEVRLDTEDAEFVEVHHTTMGPPAGHLDIYYNGVGQQPSCGVPDNQVAMQCSSAIIERFYMETMEADCMMGEPAEVVDDGGWDIKQVKLSNTKTPSKLAVGLSTPYTARGVYLVFTNQDSPFCKQ